MSEYFFPKLRAVEASAPYRLRTTWSTGEVLMVDVEDVLRRIPVLMPILQPEVFASVHVGEWGHSIEWIDEEFGADNVYAWAKEQAGQISHQMFGEWIHRNGLSLSTAAEVLGISRRMVSYYRTAHKAIPRQTWLACLDWEATRPKGRTIPRDLSTTSLHAAATI
uniref:DUF2442 domain-containing protein n=1 Tax=Candidatus Kentrum sp. DK TaxID=2126562 RepID=A0A450SQ11_9GAMM|nr:MAG: Protein of unknown function (DUF2442) [Candidatus Kentron sp. DK]